MKHISYASQQPGNYIPIAPPPPIQHHGQGFSRPPGNIVHTSTQLVPLVVGGEDAPAGRVMAVLRLPDTRRASLLIAERGAGRHGASEQRMDGLSAGGGSLLKAHSVISPGYRDAASVVQAADAPVT